MLEKKEGRKQRTQVKDLPKKEKELTKNEQKEVKSGEDIGTVDCDARGLAIGRGIRVRST